jgi:hypothetical protein
VSYGDDNKRRTLTRNAATRSAERECSYKAENILRTSRRRGNRKKGAHPKGLPELFGQNVVKDGIDGAGYIIKDARSVVQEWTFVCAPVNRPHALRVEWSPTDEEGDHHGH